MADKFPTSAQGDSPDRHRSAQAIVAAATTFVALEVLVVAQFALAYQDGLLTHSQMNLKGLGAGLPLVWHFGVWSDGLMLSGLLAWMTQERFHSWTRRQLLISSSVTLPVTALAVWSYTLSDLPGGHVVNNSLTSAGWVHAIYMWVALTVILGFFLFVGPADSPRARATVSLLLVGHVFVGTHMLLGLVNLANALPWYEQAPLESFQGWAALVLVALSLLAANFWVRPTLR